MPRIEPFERHAREYDDWFDRNAGLYRAELKAVRRLLPGPGAEGMEVGVGSGMFAEPLGIGIGVEPSPSMAERAAARGIEVHPGVAEDLPFPDGRFDFVLMVTTICFVDDVAVSFREAARVLRNGGSIIVGFVDRNSELGRRYLLRRDESRFYGEASFYSTREVLDYLEEAGFSVTDTVQALIPGEPPESVLEGSGRGSFVAIRGEKGQGSSDSLRQMAEDPASSRAPPAPRGCVSRTCRSCCR
ncbi:methyltransferase domain-containing protein [Candidatus Fermentibacterales bacterium]|nr:methyltransferase domain-containing protein [Candidatus Fermentibacterales bacterium]